MAQKKKSKIETTKKHPIRSFLAKNMRTKVIYGLFVLAFAVVGGVLIFKSFAAVPGLYVTPASSSVTVGQTVTFSIRLNLTSPVDGVDSTLTYDPAAMDFVSVDATNSAFPVELLSSGANGTVRVVRGIFNPDTVTGDVLVANVTFKTKLATTSTALKISGNASYQGSYVNPALTGATLTVAGVAVPPPPADTAAPTVTITSPLNGAKAVKSRFIINTNAMDDVKVSKLEIYIDNGVVYSNTGSTASYTWNVKPRTITRGAHTITVKAYDSSGNVGQSSVTVYK